ncbi:MAG: hypothetical protein WKF78_05775 [Candidatus Limnocylindrales bacterium]
MSAYLPRRGVAGTAQSGSVTDAFVHSGSRVGFSRIISCGPEVVLDVCDYLAYCLDDPETTSVIPFVEGFKRPERFLALADRALHLAKPIKVGRSHQAQAAAMAHSGSLAGDASLIADMAPRTRVDLPPPCPRRGPRSWSACSSWAMSGTRSTRGVPQIRRRRTEHASRPWPPARRTTSWSSSDYFPYRSRRRSNRSSTADRAT